MNNSTKEKIEWIGKKLFEKSFFNDKFYQLSCGELPCSCIMEKQHVCYIFQNEFYPSAIKINTKIAKMENILYSTLKFEQEYKISMKECNILEKYIEYQKKNLLIFLNVIYGKNYRSLEKYNINKMLRDGVLLGYIRQGPYAVPNVLSTKDLEKILIYEEVAMAFWGEPLENMKYVND